MNDDTNDMTEPPIAGSDPPAVMGRAVRAARDLLATLAESGEGVSLVTILTKAVLRTGRHANGTPPPRPRPRRTPRRRIPIPLRTRRATVTRSCGARPTPRRAPARGSAGRPTRQRTRNPSTIRPSGIPFPTMRPPTMRPPMVRDRPWCGPTPRRIRRPRSGTTRRWARAWRVRRRSTRIWSRSWSASWRTCSRSTSRRPRTSNGYRTGGVIPRSCSPWTRSGAPTRPRAEARAR